MKIEHVALYVDDLEGALEFFRTYFDAKAGHKYHNEQTSLSSYFLSFDDGSRLEIMHRYNLQENSNSIFQKGFIHIAISVGSKENVDNLAKRLKDDGYEILSGPRTTGNGYYESTIKGFEGNLIEITI